MQTQHSIQSIAPLGLLHDSALHSVLVIFLGIIDLRGREIRGQDKIKGQQKKGTGLPRTKKRGIKWAGKGDKKPKIGDNEY